MWIFIRSIGDSWSHIAVQCALESQINLVLLSGSRLLGQSLATITNRICDLIIRRHEAGVNHGVILIPGGFLTEIFEIRQLLSEIVDIMRNNVYATNWDSIRDVAARLKPSTAAIFDALPRDVQYEMCFGRYEQHKNRVDLGSISTDRLLLRFVEIELQRRRCLGLLTEDFFRGKSFPMIHQARSAMPTNFDCDLAYTLGWGAGILTARGKTGHLVHASDLQKPIDQWRLGSFPLSCLLGIQVVGEGEAKEHRVVPAMVHLLKCRGIVRPFSRLPPPQDRMAVYQGPVQYWGEAADDPAMRTTWFMEAYPAQDPTQTLREISDLCGELQSAMASAKAESTLYTVNNLLQNALSVLDAYNQLHLSSQKAVEGPVELVPTAWRMKLPGVQAEAASRPKFPGKDDW